MRKKKKQFEHIMLADMHSDGVYFDPKVLYAYRLRTKPEIISQGKPSA